MYDYTYSYQTTTTPFAAIFAMLAAYSLVISAITIFMMVCQWRLFKKAGKKGWEAFIPFYNLITLFQILELPLWYIILFFVPIAQLFVLYKMGVKLASKFGMSSSFALLCIFVPIVAYPVLAFGKAVYVGTGSNSYQPKNQDNMQQSETEFQQPVVEPVQSYQQPVVEPVQSYQQPVVEPSMEKSFKFCPNCGSKVENSATNCFMCGSKF